MRIIIKVADNLAVPGDKALMLFNEHGEPLPNVHAVTMQSAVGEFVSVRSGVLGQKVGGDQPRLQTSVKVLG